MGSEVGNEMPQTLLRRFPAYCSIVPRHDRLRHGYASALLNSLLQDKNFLDDQRAVVEAFAREIISKVDERIHPWFLERYWKELEKIADDASQNVFLRRGIYFCRAIVAMSGHLFTADDWHAEAGRYPKILTRVLLGKPFFASIGERAQDSLIGFALDQASERASILQYVDWLLNEEALSERQKERFLKCVDEMEFSDLRSAKLSLAVCFKRLIAELDFCPFCSTQNPYFSRVFANGGPTFCKP